MGFNLHQNIKSKINTGGLVIETFGQLGWFFLEKFLLELKWWYQVQWFKSPDNEREEFPLSQHLVEKSWERTEESWVSAALGQYSLGTVVMGQCGLGTVQSWDSGHGTVQSWDSSLGTVVLG